MYEALLLLFCMNCKRLILSKYQVIRLIILAIRNSCHFNATPTTVSKLTRYFCLLNYVRYCLSKSMCCVRFKMISFLYKQQQARSGQSISERTLEECWSTLQRVSWHLFQCVLLSSKSRGLAAAALRLTCSIFEFI